MRSVDVIPPVMVALDVPNVKEAISVADKLDELSRDEVGFIVRSGMLATCLLPKLLDRGYFIIGGTRYYDAPAKMGLDIRFALRAEDEDGRPRPRPHALTLQPPATTSRQEIEAARQFVSEAHAIELQRHNQSLFADSGQGGSPVNFSLIGVAQPENFHQSDGEQIGNQACNEAVRALTIGVSAFEVVFNGLEHFYEERANQARILQQGPVRSALMDDDQSVILASKLSLSGLGLRETASKAYRLKANSVILGRSVVASEQPAEVVYSVLEQRV